MGPKIEWSVVAVLYYLPGGAVDFAAVDGAADEGTAKKQVIILENNIFMRNWCFLEGLRVI